MPHTSSRKQKRTNLACKNQGGHFAAIEMPKELMQDQEEFITSLNWGK